MQLYLDVRSQAYPRQEAVNQAGVALPYHDERQRHYVSIFGKLAFRRPYFYRKEVGGYSPLDAALGLGADSYSDFLRELHEELGVQVAFDKIGRLLGRLLDLHLSKRCLQAFLETDAATVDDVLATLVNEEKTATDQPEASRHQPQHKQLWGTLAGKQVALDRLQRQVAKRDGNHIQRFRRH